MYEFNAEDQMKRCIKWIESWFDCNGKDCNAVIGISGGVDSSVAAALCVEALGIKRVYGIMMPNGIQTDIDYSKELIYYTGIPCIECNIGNSINTILGSIENGIYYMGSNHIINFSEQTRINLPARIRMTTLYAISQSINGRVVNTCNLSEDWVGYSTKYGDAAGDFSPLSTFTKTEVKQIGKALGLPDKMINKIPTDGLCGKTDEDNLGFTYEVLDRYIRTGEIEDQEVKKRIDELHAKNLFKLRPMEHYKSGINSIGGTYV